MVAPVSRNTDDFPWDGVFQNREEVDQYFSGDRITCLLCGEPFLVLASHIKTAHGVQVDEYKQRYGIPWRRGLTSAGTRQKYSNLMKSKKAAGILPQQPSPEHMAMLRTISKASHRPMVPATRNAVSQHYLKLHGREEKWGDADYYEYLKRIATGRTIKEVGQDKDMPAEYLFYKYRRRNPDYARRFEEIWDKLPFPVQVRGQHSGMRLKETIVMLRDVFCYSWPEIGEIMDVKESTARTAYHHLKHSGQLEAIRARLENYG